jgi:serine/threonine protein kinase
MAASSLVSSPGSAAADIASRLVGQTLGRTYRVLDTLDQGGMGVVFVAEHVRLRRRVAVKVLAGHLASMSTALARFEREAEVISQLAHPHIVSVLDFDRTEQGEPYLVMELLQGESLADRLDRLGTFEPDQAVSITSQIASGLAAAHHAGIVHRDLKPANVFLMNVENDQAFVKLLDFGISKVSSGTHLTQQFDIIGTPDYMSPEQACGRTALVDHRGDQYSLAVLSFEMLAGRLPFVADTVPMLLHKVIHEGPPSLREIDAGFSPMLDTVLRRALAKRPGDRYESVSEFAAALASASGQRYSSPATLDRDSMTVATATGEPTRERTERAPTVLNENENPTSYRIAVEPSARAQSPSDPSLGSLSGDRVSQTGERRSRALSPEASDPSLANELQQARSKPVSKIMRRRLKVDNAMLVGTSLTAQEAFIISRLVEGSTVEEALDLSPLGRDETLTLLAGLAQRRLVS